MNDYIVFTNNSIVAEFFSQKDYPLEIKWIAAPAIQVLTSAKSVARLGAVILSNPMGGVRPANPLMPIFESPPFLNKKTKSDKPEKFDKLEKFAGPENPDKLSKLDKFERLDKLDKFDKSQASAPPANAPRIASLNPYISLLIRRTAETVDFASVKKLDEAINIYKKNTRLRYIAHNEDTIKAYQTVDLEMLAHTLAALETGVIQ